MKPIIELSGLLSFRLFKTYLPLAHHSSWNVLEEINAVRTQMPTLIQRHDAIWMKLRTQASLYQITSLLFMNMEEKGKKKNQLWLQGVIIKTYNRKTHNSVLVISPYEICMIMYYWIKTYNVLRGFGILHLLRQLDISQCSLMLYSIPHLSFLFLHLSFLWKLIRLSPLSTHAATNEWGFRIQTLHWGWCHLSRLINLCDLCVMYRRFTYPSKSTEEKIIFNIM